MRSNSCNGRRFLALATLALLIMLCACGILLQRQNCGPVLQQYTGLRVTAKDNTVISGDVSTESRDLLASVLNRSQTLSEPDEELRQADGALTFYGGEEKETTALVWVWKEGSLLFYCNNRWLCPNPADVDTASQCLRTLLWPARKD